MDDSNSIVIELGRYVEVLMRQWQLIVSATLVCALVAGLVSVALPKQYQARALIASTKVASSVSFGSSIQTLSEEQLLASGTGAYGLVNREARLASYVELIDNPVVAQKVLDQLGERLPQEIRSVPELLKLVSGDVAGKTDSIAVKVVYTDPVLAADIANAWARAYAQEVNAVYSAGNDEDSYIAVQEQTRESRQKYDTAENALLDFYQDNQIDSLTSQVNQQQTLIDSLVEARRLAISTTVGMQSQAQLQVIGEYMDAQVENQLLALGRDRQSRRDMILAYIDGLTSSRKSVFTEQLQSQLDQLRDAYAEARQIDIWLQAAQDMRDQVAEGGAGAAASNSLALTLLKAEVFTSRLPTSTVDSSTEQPVQESSNTPGLQVQANTVPLEPAAMLADLDGLISVLQQRQTAMDEEIQSLSESLMSGDQLRYLDVPLENSGALAQAIQERYPELFETGALSEISFNQIADGNPLADEIQSRVTALLELQGLDGLLNYNTGNAPIDAKIVELQGEVRKLQASLAEQEDQQRELIRARDLAWDTYSNLATKEAELAVAVQTKGTEVALASPAAVPSDDLVSGARNVVMAAIAGLLLGIFAAYAIEFWWAYKGIEPYPIQIIPFRRRHKPQAAPR